MNDWIKGFMAWGCIETYGRWAGNGYLVDRYSLHYSLSDTKVGFRPWQ